MNRKLSTIKPILYAVFGTVVGIALKKWWDKPCAEPCLNQVEVDELYLNDGNLEGRVGLGEVDSRRAEPCQEQAHTLADTQQATKQSIKEKSLPLDDPRGNRRTVYFGDQKLELVENSLADTQPIRTQQDKTLYNCYCSYCKCHCQSYSLYCIHCGREMSIISKVVKESKDE